MSEDATSAIAGNSLSVSVLDGFIKRCAAEGMNDTQISLAFRQAGLLGILQTPGIKAGFDACIKQSNVDLTHVMHPDTIALAVESRLHHGDDVFSQHYRNAWKPDLDDDATMTKAAAAMWDRYNELDPKQRAISAALLGGAVGAGARTMTSTPEDAMLGRTPFSKAVRGAMTGAITGAGASAGHTMGQKATNDEDPRNNNIASMLTGLMGGYGANQLAHGTASLVS